MRKWIFLALAFTGVAFAAAPSAQLTWGPVTTDTNGNALANPVTYSVYQGVGSGNESSTPVQTGLASNTVTITAGLTPGTTACFQVTASAAGVESAHSAEACKSFSQTPAAPSGLTVK